MCVVWLNLSSWSIRKGKPTATPLVAPAPAICGGKKRAATEDVTKYALKPWVSGTSARMANPGILELCQSMGKVMGVLPSTLKSKALWVYFQMYSPLTTACFPKACCTLAWNSLRKPGCRFFDTTDPATVDEQASSGASTGLEQPWLDRTRFSLNGVSRVRA